MKKYSVLLFALVFISCEGSMGPRGPQGPPGPPGPIGQVFERTVDFTSQNNYIVFRKIPKSIEVYPSDIVMAYMLWSETGPDIWQPLPVSVFFQNDDELKYAFDYTVADVRLFLRSDAPLSSYGPTYTQNKTFRIVVLPATIVEKNNINLKDMDAVMGLVKGNRIR